MTLQSSKITCLVVDDEPLARNGLASYVEKIPFLQLIDTCESALELLEKLNQIQIDVIFLDIQMPNLTGIELLRSFSTRSMPCPLVVLTTAYSEYALEGYQLDVMDYLVKPISFGRFLQAAQKVQQRLNTLVIAQSEPTFFFVKTDNRLEKIYFDDIHWIESQRNYVEIHTSSKVFKTYLTLQQIENELPSMDFIRIQKSFIVAKKAVEAIEGNLVVIQDKKIPISRQKTEEIINQLLDNQLLRRK